MKVAESKTTSRSHSRSDSQLEHGRGESLSDGQKPLPLPIQTKLTIGKPGDKYEREADAMADYVVDRLSGDRVNGDRGAYENVHNSVDQVSGKWHAGASSGLMRKPIFESDAEGVQAKFVSAVPNIQAKRATYKAEEEQQENAGETEMPEVMRNPIFESDAEGVQAKAVNQPVLNAPLSNSGISTFNHSTEESELSEKESLEEEAPSSMGKLLLAYDTPTDHSIIQRSTEGGDSVDTAQLENRLSSSGNGAPLPEGTRTQMEDSFGADFGGVRIHTNESAKQMNQGLGAQAFTHGKDIYFNEGKYKPDDQEGQKLLAHELTHTIQQGASKPGVQPKPIQKQPTPVSQVVPGPASLTAADISSKFEPDEQMAAYLEANYRKYVMVPVRIGKLASGQIKVRQTKKAKSEGDPARYQIKKNQGIPFLGIDFLNRLQSKGLEPVIAVKATDPNSISGIVSLRVKNRVLPDPKNLITEINKNLELLGLFGVSKLKVPNYENKVENGTLTFMVQGLKTQIAGYLDAEGEMGMVGGAFVFSLQANVDIAGLANGSFQIQRDEKGTLQGEGEIGTQIAFVSGKVKATYNAGDVTIQGTVGMQSEKFSGEISLMVVDEKTANDTMMAALGVEEVQLEGQKPPDIKAKSRKTPKNQVVVGWGNVTVQVTPWLQGKADVGVDSKGQVTIIGEIAFTEDITLMEQKGKKVELFEVEIKAGYGVPLVGQIGLFASIGMFLNAGFGPLLLKDVKMIGRYSTNPAIMTEVSITGNLNINAFVVIGLTAKAGAFVTLIGHDIKAGLGVTAAASIKAFAETTPTFEYKEKPSPEGGAVGESRLKGHFEAATQLFLMLGGSFFVELDSPWWSPAPDETWDFPMGEIEYPLGDVGIGGDVDWLVGSEDPPELQFAPVEFDPDKFTADIMADPPPGKGGGKGGKQEKQGKFEDGRKKGDKVENPEVKKEGEGLKGKKKKEDLSKLTDQQRYMRALGEVGDLGTQAKQKPLTQSVLAGKLKRIKSKYNVSKIQLADQKDGSIKVFVQHNKEDNKHKLIEVKVISEAERNKQLSNAKEDLLKIQAGKIDKQTKSIKESDAKTVAADVDKKHDVVESVKVVDGDATWDYVMDLGDKDEKVKGGGKTSPIGKDEEKHERIADQALEEITSNDYGDKSYEELRSLKEKEAKKIEDKYQPQLEGNIKITISFLSKAEDEKDQDLDIKVTIAPNTTVKEKPIKLKSTGLDLSGVKRESMGVYFRDKVKKKMADKYKSKFQKKGLDSGKYKDAELDIRHKVSISDLINNWKEALQGKSVAEAVDILTKNNYPPNPKNTKGIISALKELFMDANNDMDNLFVGDSSANRSLQEGYDSEDGAKSPLDPSFDDDKAEFIAYYGAKVKGKDFKLTIKMTDSAGNTVKTVETWKIT